MNGITRETYETLDEQGRSLILFDLAMESHQCACRLDERMSVLEKKVDRRKWFDTKVSAGTGFLGGAAAFFFSKIWGK